MSALEKQTTHAELPVAFAQAHAALVDGDGKLPKDKEVLFITQLRRTYGVSTLDLARHSLQLASEKIGRRACIRLLKL